MDARDEVGGGRSKPGDQRLRNCLGEQFVRCMGFTWVVVSDEQGTEIAVLREPGEVLVFPPNLVAKRYVDGTPSFFRKVFNDTERALAAFQQPAAGKKPWWKVWG